MEELHHAQPADPDGDGVDHIDIEQLGLRESQARGRTA